MKRTALGLSACLLTLALAAPAFAAGEDPAKPIKTVVGSVRQGRDKAALKQFASEEQGKLLTADYWAKGTDAQRKEFTELFNTLFAKIAFPKIRENFKNLDTILYEAPKVEGDKATVGSTILINHPLKKQELKTKYTLKKSGAEWKVVDVAVLGDSMLTGIRDDQVQPLLKEGGWEGLLQAMRVKAKELEKVELK
jgi:phospholipid transport system substrate-binding protein